MPSWRVVRLVVSIGLATLAVVGVVKRYGEPRVSSSYSVLHAELMETIGPRAVDAGRLVGLPGQISRGGARGLSNASPSSALGFAGSDGLWSRKTLEIEAEVERRLGDGAYPESLATAAVMNMLSGRPQLAVEQLESAVEASPKDGRMLSDLSVAYLQQAQLKNTPHLFVDALEAATEALVLKSAMPEARFNLALVLDELALWREAHRAWEAYLDLDTSSEWARWAHQRVDAIDHLLKEHPTPRLELTPVGGLEYDEAELERRVREEPNEARRMAENELLPQWAETYRREEFEEAERLLSTARRLGSTLRRVTGDPLIEEAVTLIDEASQWSGKAKLRMLADGHRHYADGLATAVHDDCADAGSPLMEARRLFAEAGSPFEGWAAIELAICHYYGRDYGEAWRHLDRASLIAADGKYPALAGRTLWISGLISMVEGDLASSLASYQKAIYYFDEVLESEHVAYLHSLMAKNLRILGASREAWVHRHLGLKNCRAIPGADRRFTILQEAAETVEREAGDASHYFLSELIAEAERAWDPEFSDLAPFARLQRAEAMIWRARPEAARDDLVKAQDALRELPATSSFWPLIDLRLRRAEALLARDRYPQQAADLLEEAISFHAGRGSPSEGERVELLAAYLQRAQLLRQLGRPEEALGDLRKALEEAERQRNLIQEPSLRAEAGGARKSLYLELASLQLALGRSAEALETIDQSRLRLSHDLVAGDTGELPSETLRPFSVQELSSRLPEGAVVVAYAALSDRLAIWTITPKSLAVKQVAIDREDLIELVEDLLDSVGRRGSAEEVRSHAARLGNILLAPVTLEDGIESLIIVPSPELAGVPFAALYDGSRGGYLVERYSIVVIPVLATLPDRLNRRRIDGGPGGILLVSSPAFERTIYPSLPPLRPDRALEEALRKRFGQIGVLEGEEATEAALLERLSRSKVVHFSGHAIVNPSGGGLSGLLLAPTESPRSRGSNGILEPAELAASKISTLELIVLEGCRTAVGAGSGGDEIAGLVAAFQAAGVPTVLASLWEVDDHVTSGFSRRFYAGLADGLPAHHALQKAMVTAARSEVALERIPFYWAGYQVYGLP